MNDLSYADYVRLRVQSNPCIWGLSEHLKRNPRGESRINLVDYPHDGSSQSTPEPLPVTEDECVKFASDVPSNTNRLLIVENITPNLIVQIGRVLDVDPLFFADYVVTDFQDIEKQPPPPSLAILPSLISKRGHFHLHYQKVLDLGGAEPFANAAYGLKTDSNIPRNVRRLAPLSGRQLALARASCSMLIKTIESSCICLILVDRPITYVGEALGTKRERTYQAKAMYSGFEDFEPSKSFSSFANDKAHDAWDKTSMLDSIVHYFRAQPPPGFHTPCPRITSIGYYPIRIVLSEWNLYIHLTSRFSKYYEYSLRDMSSRLHDNDIVDLQRWRRRCKQSRHKLALLADFINHWVKDEDDKEPWAFILKDVDYLRQQLQDYGQSLEQMVTVATSMVQLLDSRRSILEAVNVRRLTYIALVFVPLAWVSSLFSMSDGYSPGGDHFWVYFVTALPLLGLVLLLSALPYERLLQVFRKGWGNLLCRGRLLTAQGAPV
ncbi:Zinc transport [Fusarium albosuccineum]|uniref:Zinc transport n=1 Tax=Fusarium albosuccineum TaxID=1237068 RepID=A0A8H4L0Y2_9HYPO|nr:Zinc transport [Fusarium albosuccineum]